MLLPTRCISTVCKEHHGAARHLRCCEGVLKLIFAEARAKSRTRVYSNEGAFDDIKNARMDEHIDKIGQT